MNANTPTIADLLSAGSQTAKSTGPEWQSLREASRLSARHRRTRCPAEPCGIHLITVSEARPSHEDHENDY